MDKSKIKSLAIGHFDGIHLGHKALFSYCFDGGILVIENDRLKLTPKRESFINLPIFYKNINDIKNLSPEEFIKLLKNEFVNLKKIVVGYDFKFGKNRSADAIFLKNIFDGEVVIVNEKKINNISVHSEKIREFLKKANIKMANLLLDRVYEIKGNLIKGQGLGKKELFSTINLDTSNYFLPKNGVYATFTNLNNKDFKSVTFIGNRLSTDDKFSVETHIIEPFSEDKINGKITIKFKDFIRDNKKFENLNELKFQITKDILKVQDILKKDELWKMKFSNNQF